MIPVPSPARRRAARAIRWLTAAAFGGLALMATATAAQAAPTPIAINTANWSANAGFGSLPPAWYIDGAGVVHLQGAAAQTSAFGPLADLVGTLPPAAAPSAAVFASVQAAGGTTAGVEIEPNGDIIAVPIPAPAASILSFLSLDGISYSPGTHVMPIPINAQNWGYCPGCGAQAPSWYLDNTDVVHLEGAVRQISPSGNEPNVIGTLPQSAAPAQTVYTLVHTAGGYAGLAIEPNGQLTVIDPRPPAVKDYGLVSLDSITYRPAGQGSPVTLNDENWSGGAGYGSRPPSWYTDGSGLVHLQGAVHQTTPAGQHPNLVGYLPAAAAPAHPVFFAVHTFLGTYADLTIAPSGAITLTNPPPPLVTDYTLVSLESIVYRP